MSARLEHANITVRRPDRTAETMRDLFGWRIRWSGPSIGGGRSVHVGGEDNYIALYSPKTPPGEGGSSYEAAGGLNHIGVVVSDFEATERRVLAAGFETYSHSDYEPGRRFYFRDGDGIEFEVVSYDIVATSAPRP
ncbi:MAG: VOC family protein [Alphaproteobacteria bacterium]|nr:VOC family protein [Alphaproteobacteria bacterium]